MLLVVVGRRRLRIYTSLRYTLLVSCGMVNIPPARLLCPLHRLLHVLPHLPWVRHLVCLPPLLLFKIRWDGNSMPSLSMFLCFDDHLKAPSFRRGSHRSLAPKSLDPLLRRHARDVQEASLVITESSALSSIRYEYNVKIIMSGESR